MCTIGAEMELRIKTKHNTAEDRQTITDLIMQMNADLMLKINSTGINASR